MENNKATPQEEFDAQEDFKNMMAQAFAKQIQGVTIDNEYIKQSIHERA
jgi:hypothetical protein